MKIDKIKKKGRCVKKSLKRFRVTFIYHISDILKTKEKKKSVEKWISGEIFY